MNAEGWRRLEELFHAAMALDGGERVAFLAQACEGDEALRRKLEEMTSGGTDAEAFLEWPPVGATQMLARWEGASRRENTERFVRGKEVSHYRIVETVAVGGTGIVYKAEDTALGRFVALKFLVGMDAAPGGHVAADAQWLEGLRREARICSALDHPNICAVYEIGEHDGVPFIAMPLLNGRTLKQEIGDMPISADRIVDIGMQLADALDAAHAAGIVHRDVKPTNIFVTQRGEAKLLDFGLAKLAHRPPVSETGATHVQAEAPTSGDTLTVPGAPPGTVAYMSPEQVRGEALDARTDVFSLGLVLYEMAAGHAAFEGELSGDVANAILHDEPRALRECNPAIPGELARIIADALTKDREARLQTAAQFRERLTALRGGSQPKRWFDRYWPIGAIAAAASVTTLSIILPFGERESAPPRPLNAVVLSDFTNTTGEHFLGDALKEGLRAQLEQSPFLTVLSDQKAGQELRYMGRAPNTPLSRDVAREICLRSASSAVVSGSILRLGSDYVLGVEAVDCKSGNLVDSEQVEAPSHTTIIAALGRAATALRSKLGESLASIRKFDAPPEEVTTISLEALQAYTLASRIMAADGVNDSIPFFKQAADLDPEFAMAYAKLATAYLTEGEQESAEAAMTKAYALRGRVSERERLYIESHYFHTVTGDYERAIQAYRLWQQIYPNDVIPDINLSALYQGLGQYGRTLEAALRVLRLDPNSPNGYFVVANAYLDLNAFDKAEEVLKRAEQRKLINPMFWGVQCALAFVRGDEEGLARRIAAAMTLPGNLDSVLAFRADVEAYEGHLRAARASTRQAIESARRNGDSESVFDYGLAGALREAEFGNFAEARKRLAGLATTTDRRALALTALAYARAGEPARASLLAHGLEERYAQDSLVRSYWLPTVQAAIDVDRGNTAQALEVLAQALPYELSVPQTSTNIVPYPIYVRGLAFLEAGRGHDAVLEFRKILDHPGLVANCPLGALALLGLARAYSIVERRPAFMLASEEGGRGSANDGSQTGAPDNARSAYKAFLSRWNGADADIPILLQAKAEYAALR